MLFVVSPFETRDTIFASRSLDVQWPLAFMAGYYLNLYGVTIFDLCLSSMGMQSSI